MGMFDEIICEHELPGGFRYGVGHRFQTKSFDCTLSEYHITKTGKIIAEDWHYEFVPKEKRPYPDDDGLLGVCGMLKKVVRERYFLEYTGRMSFYTLIDVPVGNETERQFHEFEARFEGGMLQDIQLHVVKPKTG